MNHIFVESKEISIKNKGKSKFSDITLQPYIFVRGSFLKIDNKLKVVNYSCGDCGDILTSNYTKGLGMCAICYNK